ncbi:protein PERCC1-like [Ptychodera flava]|uniref:protein PERCC1-like n=1 Tax=Ptychodera flava TaxID=63121 RepID=UPI00396AAFE7
MTECLTSKRGFTLPKMHEQEDMWDQGSCDDESDIDEMDDYESEYEEETTTADIGPNVTQQLLSFAEMVNGDIQKYFGRKADSEDSCNIYEDRFSMGKSGRELYYADLLKIAQNGDPTLDELRPRQSGSDKNKKRTVVVNSNHENHKGKGKSLGPFNELFEFAIGKHLAERKTMNSYHHKKIKRLKLDLKKHDKVIPWQNRNLPKSFFKEPNSPAKKNGIMHPSSTPDFSDLIAIYDDDDFSGSGDLSSSDQEISVASVESVHENHV